MQRHPSRSEIAIKNEVPSSVTGDALVVVSTDVADPALASGRSRLAGSWVYRSPTMAFRRRRRGMSTTAAAVVLAAVAVALAAGGSAFAAVAKSGQSGKAVAAGLPAPIFRVSGTVDAVAAAGHWLAVAVDQDDGNCSVAMARITTGPVHPVMRIPGGGADQFGCATGDGSTIDRIWVGRSDVFAITDDSDPDGSNEDFSLWRAALGGTFSKVGVNWGWTQIDSPPEYGCTYDPLAAGGGVVVIAAQPNATGIDNNVASKPSCPNTGQTVLELFGTSPSQVTVTGSWEPVLTDGKNILLVGLDPSGHTIDGKVELVGLDGTIEATPPGADTVVSAKQGASLVAGKLVFPVKGSRGWTVGYGYLVYVEGSSLRVRRLSDGVDRAVVTLPHPGNSWLVSGSFGVALVDATQGNVYRLPWHIFDQAVTR